MTLHHGTPADVALWAEIAVHLARIEAKLDRLLPSSPELLPLIADELPKDKRGKSDWFTSGEVIAYARAEATAAAATGYPEPELSAALRRAGLTTPHALGRWLGMQPGVEQGGKGRDGVRWRIVT